MVDSFFVTRTMQAIEVLAFRPCSAPEVAEVLRVDARTARRLLNRLADEGWVVRTEGRIRTYSLSLRILALAAHHAERSPLARGAVPSVRALSERTGEVAYLTIPSYRSVLCLVHHAQELRSQPHLRELIPAHASAGGKVLLAHREPWRESVLELPLERFTARTVVDADAIRSECSVTLERGYAVEDGEYRESRQSIAAPVPDDTGDVMAAIALSCDRERDVGALVEAVLGAADEMRRRLSGEDHAVAA